MTTVVSYIRQMSHLICKMIGCLLFLPFFKISNNDKVVDIDIFEICVCENSVTLFYIPGVSLIPICVCAYICLLMYTLKYIYGCVNIYTEDTQN